MLVYHSIPARNFVWYAQAAYCAHALTTLPRLVMRRLLSEPRAQRSQPMKMTLFSAICDRAISNRGIENISPICATHTRFVIEHMFSVCATSTHLTIICGVKQQIPAYKLMSRSAWNDGWFYKMTCYTTRLLSPVSANLRRSVAWARNFSFKPHSLKGTWSPFLWWLHCEHCEADGAWSIPVDYVNWLWSVDSRN